jgi:hypothetical protein
MSFLMSLSSAARIGFWLTVTGLVLGLFLGYQLGEAMHPGTPVGTVSQHSTAVA